MNRPQSRYAASAKTINAALAALTNDAQRQTEIARLQGELSRKGGGSALVCALSDLFAERHLALVEAAYDLGAQHGRTESEVPTYSREVDRFADDLLMVTLCSDLPAAQRALALMEVARACLLAAAPREPVEAG